MVKVFIEFIYLVGLVTIGCSHSFHKSENYQEAAYNDFNKAPTAMVPPEINHNNVDSLYLRTQADYHFSLGESLSLNGETARAIEEFKLTLLYDPDVAVVHLRLSVEYVKMGLIGESIETCNKAIDLNPNLEEARILLGGIYSSLKMFDQAYEQYNEAIKINPNNFNVLLYIGILLAEQKKYDEAILHFEKIAKNNDESSAHTAHFYIGGIKIAQFGEKGYVEAEKYFIKSIKLKPDYLDGVLALSQLYQKWDHNIDKAIQVLSRFQEKYGPDEKIAEHLAFFYLEKKEQSKALEQLEIVEAQSQSPLSIKLKVALLYIELKRYDEAIRKLEEILNQVPDSDKARFYLAAVYEEVKNYSTAVIQFQKIPTTSSFYTEAVIHAAYLYKLLGEADKAIEVIEEGITHRAGEQPQIYTLFASILEERKEYGRAIKMLTSAVEKFPSQTQLLFFLGSLHDRNGNLRETILNMKKVLELDSNNVRALNYLAYTYAENGLYLDDAESMARKALEHQPEDPYILDTLGWVLFKKGRVEESVKILEIAFSKKQTESIIAEHLGDAYYSHQLHQKAKAMYLKAVAIDLKGESVDKIRQKISAIELKESFHQRLPASESKKNN